MNAGESYPATWGAILSIVAIGYALAAILGLAWATQWDTNWSFPGWRLSNVRLLDVFNSRRGTWGILLAILLQGTYLVIECTRLAVSPFDSSGLLALLLSVTVASCVLMISLAERETLVRPGLWVCLMVAAVSGAYGVVQIEQPHMPLLDLGGAGSFWIQGASAAQIVAAVSLTLAIACSAAALTMPRLRESALARELLDERSYHFVRGALPPSLVSALCHMIWNQQVRGVVWSGEAAETWTLLAVAYPLIYMHMWSRRGWRGQRIALFGLAGVVGALAPVMAAGTASLVM